MEELFAIADIRSMSWHVRFDPYRNIAGSEPIEAQRAPNWFGPAPFAPGSGSWAALVAHWRDGNHNAEQSILPA